MGEKHLEQLRWFLTYILREKDGISARNGENPIAAIGNIMNEHMADVWKNYNCKVKSRAYWLREPGKIPLPFWALISLS